MSYVVSRMSYLRLATTARFPERAFTPPLPSLPSSSLCPPETAIQTQPKTQPQNQNQNPKNQPPETNKQNLDSGLQERPYLFNAITVVTSIGAVAMFLAFLAFAYRRRLIVF